MVRKSRREEKAIREEYEREFAEPATAEAKDWWLNFALVVGGVLLLVLGSRWLVDAVQAFGLVHLLPGDTQQAGEEPSERRLFKFARDP